ncbi:Fmu (Sun) domain-containing protein [Thermincola ferriacetica]|uniref:Fmu (Sun) domain-containing protein n=1 Tax=Thermincola ferriacetica TaxID=281456 RepID=A0A0L6W1G4_9FIRM|nr:RsmB/NOP family class I SAM-dependent RNA methyltransferase [Thermincola ferriacetica]KNZ69233.1 Fmu (Sun) domain-containing protein [Thermincola ferriacetica]
MRLPPAFLTKMEQQLGSNVARFLQSYTEPRTAGLRANTLKISPEALQELLPFLQERVSWCRDGFYYNEEEVRPAKLPHYYAGLYYIQEPSAMLPAELLQVQPGERVLDLCAAPGGKSLQLAAHLGKAGLLVVNDPHPQRAKVLLKNIERYGVTNAVVLSETPQRLAHIFADFFDKILVDAPCSGEGMFRKEPEMAKNWSEAEVAKYAKWQAAILEHIPQMLRPGGEVVYSTCTFSREENEQQVLRFLGAFPDFELLEMRRLWPHEVRGEGHFAAKIKNLSLQAEKKECLMDKNGLWRQQEKNGLTPEAKQALAEFSLQVWQAAEGWQAWLPEGGMVIERAGHILWESLCLPPLRGLKVLRSGWLLGTIQKGRFRPSPAFALGLPPEAVHSAIQRLDLSSHNADDNSVALRYLRGETIQREGKVWAKGWHLVSLDGFVLGWAKGAGNWLKNEFPPGWRRIDGEER